MERLIAAAAPARLYRPWQRLAWETGRAWRAAVRRLGPAGLVLLGCGACVLLGLWLAQVQAARAGALAAQLAAQLAVQRVPPPAGTAPLAADSGMAGARARLQAFEAQLLPSAGIPFVVQQLLDLGEAEGLTMLRGNYRPQTDSAGGFLRYRMSLPVKGGGPAIERFIRAALRKQPNLALDSMQFKRSSIDTSEIEARIEWTLLARLPETERHAAQPGQQEAAP